MAQSWHLDQLQCTGLATRRIELELIRQIVAVPRSKLVHSAARIRLALVAVVPSSLVAQASVELAFAAPAFAGPVAS